MHLSLPKNEDEERLTPVRPAPTGSCGFCGRPIQHRHRQTKKYCGDLCRSRYHYARRQAAQADLMRQLQEAQARLRRLECDGS